jgi:hypothetical protein
VLRGGDGDDRLRGDETSNGGGKDTIHGGRDRLDGGPGNDHLRGDDFDDAADDEADILRGGDDVLGGLDGDDLLEGDAIFAGPGDDLITGGNDLLLGDDGVDVMHGDLIDGGPDNDRAVLGHDVMYGGYGNDSLFGDSFVNVEGTTSADDKLYGNEGVDHHDCQEGADFADGGPDVDTWVPLPSCDTAVNM